MESTLIEEEKKGPEEEFLHRIEKLKYYSEGSYGEVWLARLYNGNDVRYVAVKI